MYGIVQAPAPLLRNNFKYKFVVLAITFSILIASNSAIGGVVIADDMPIRNERSAVVFSDQGNILYDNDTLVFGAAMNMMNDDVELYLVGEEEYDWGGLGHRAAGWVRDGVLRTIPPSEVIALLKKHFMADHFHISSTVKEALVTEMPVIITSFMLIAMAIMIPIVGLIFCCCRCAGKCGGNRKEEDLVSMGTTCGVVVGFLLIIVCAFIGTLSYLTKPSIIRMVETVDHTSTVANNIIADVETYKDDFIQDLKQVGIDDLGFVTGAVHAKLDGVGKEVASPLLRDTAPYLTALSESVESLSVELTSFTSNGSALDVLLQTSANLVSAGQSLVSALDTAKDELTRIRDECLADPARVGSGACNYIPDPSMIDTSSMDFSTINIGDLDLDDLRNEMHTALATIRDLIDTGNSTLQDIPELITNTSISSIDGIRDAITQLQQVVEGLVNQTSQSLDEIFDSLNFDSLKETIDTRVQLPVEENTIDTITSLLPVILAFMVVLTSVGLLIALIGLRCNDGPQRRGCGCDCGGKMLMGSVCWSFSIALFLCILAALLLIIGTTLTIVCDSLLDLSLIQEVIDDPAVWGGKSLTSGLTFGNSTFNITVYEILENCQENVTLYDALDLGSSGFLDVVLDLDIRGILPDLTSVYEMVNDTVSGLDILPSDKANDLLSQLTGQLSPSNITEAVEQMQNGLGQVPLTNLSEALNDGADAVASFFPGMASDLRDLADDLLMINDQQLQLTINLTIALFEEVPRLNASILGVEIVAEEVSGSVSSLADFIKNEAGPIVIEGLESYIDSILSLADQFIAEVLRRIQDDMGRCGIVRNIYDAIVGSLCLYFLPGLNAFWFALSAISFALIPNIVFNVRLAKYLRRPTRTVPREAVVFDGVVVYPTPTWTPQSSIRGSPASMRRPVDESLIDIRVPRSLETHILEWRESPEGHTQEIHTLALESDGEPEADQKEEHTYTQVVQPLALPCDGEPETDQKEADTQVIKPLALPCDGEPETEQQEGPTQVIHTLAFPYDGELEAEQKEGDTQVIDTLALPYDGELEAEQKEGDTQAIHTLALPYDGELEAEQKEGDTQVIHTLAKPYDGELDAEQKEEDTQVNNTLALPYDGEPEAEQKEGDTQVIYTLALPYDGELHEAEQKEGDTQVNNTLAFSYDGEPEADQKEGDIPVINTSPSYYDVEPEAEQKEGDAQVINTSPSYYDGEPEADPKGIQIRSCHSTHL